MKHYIKRLAILLLIAELSACGAATTTESQKATQEGIGPLVNSDGNICTPGDDTCTPYFSFNTSCDPDNIQSLKLTISAVSNVASIGTGENLADPVLVPTGNTHQYFNFFPPQENPYEEQTRVSWEITDSSGTLSFSRDVGTQLQIFIYFHADWVAYLRDPTSNPPPASIFALDGSTGMASGNSPILAAYDDTFFPGFFDYLPERSWFGETLIAQVCGVALQDESGVMKVYSSNPVFFRPMEG